MTGNDFKEGQVLLFDKPYKWTSFDLVRKIRSILRINYKIQKIKVGHAGTLDPLATGLMIICTGKATKEISKFQDMNKEYIAEIKLGETTPSYDLETEVDEHFNTEHINEQLIRETLKKYEGTDQQEPPIYSAKNINGKRAYEYARKGQPVEMKSKKITVHKLELQECKLPLIKINILCGKGTYIRSLARDIGRELKTGAHLISLRRTSIGNFNVLDAKNLQEF